MSVLTAGYPPTGSSVRKLTVLSPSFAFCTPTYGSEKNGTGRSHESRAPAERRPSPPNIRVLTSGWSIHAQACGWVGLIRPNSVK